MLQKLDFLCRKEEVLLCCKKLNTLMRRKFNILMSQKMILTVSQKKTFYFKKKQCNMSQFLNFQYSVCHMYQQIQSFLMF